jgi:DNA polymerase-3 subunit delta'
VSAPEATGPSWATSLLGHEALEQAWLRSLASGRLPHAWLLTGPRGVGKATLAYRMARRLLARPGEAGSCQEAASAVFRMVATRSHPDLQVIDKPISPVDGKPKASMPVALLRQRMEELYRTSAMGGARVFLLDPDVEVGSSSGNALLKLLEEPPAGVVLLIVGQHYARLPATIASRCARLRLRPLPAPLVAEGVLRHLPDIERDRALKLAELAGGSIGRALRLHDMDWPSAYARMLGDLVGGRARMIEAAELLLRLAGKDGIVAAADLLGGVIRRGARFAAGRPPAVALAAGEAGLLAAIPGTASLDRCIGMWDKLAASAAEAEALNLDPLQTMVGLVHGLVSPGR